MTTTRLDAPATSKNTKLRVMIGAQIFAALVLVLFFVLDFGLRSGLIPDKNPGHPFGSPSVVLPALLLVILWALLSDRE
jgi:hypothetical protein